MKRVSTIVLCVLALWLTAAAQTAPSPAAVSPTTIPFELINRHIFLKVKIDNSRPLWFVFDTGDKVVIVDLGRAKELGLKLGNELHVGGAGANTLTGNLIQGSTLTIPGLSGFAESVAMGLPLAALAGQLGHDFDGIIGSDFIRQYVVEVDYQARVLKLHNNDQFNYSGPGEAIPIVLNGNGHPTLEGEVTPLESEPIKGRFVLDLGSGGSLVLHTPTVEHHHLLTPNLKTIKTLGGGGAGGEVTGQVGRVASLQIGKFKMPEPVTLFSQDKAGALTDSSLLGNIGEQIANKFKVFLDYSHNRIILEPNSTFPEPFNRASPGMRVVTEGSDYRTFRVKNILENSPATEAGVQKEDVITAINSRTAETLSLSEINEMFERPVVYKISIRRGEQTLQVTLTPRRLI